MIKAGATIILLIVHTAFSYGQIAQPGFARYLYEKGSYFDVLLLDNLDRNHLNPRELDSMNYYSGLAGYNLQLLERSNKSFLAVSAESGFHNPSRFFAAWNEFYLGNPLKGMENIQKINTSAPDEKELLDMFRTGGCLLERNITEAGVFLNIAKNEDFKYKAQWDRMDLHYGRLVGFKPKSYAAAGFLSGVIPGSGKIYAKQKGAGVSSFLLTGALAAITIENGLKSGWSRWNTLVAGGIFSLFYVGNIYGSIVSVKIYRQRFFNEVDRAILLDLSIPLRNIYL